jgi:hypothetical protein
MTCRAAVLTITASIAHTSPSRERTMGPPAAAAEKIKVRRLISAFHPSYRSLLLSTRAMRRDS